MKSMFTLFAWSALAFPLIAQGEEVADKGKDEKALHANWLATTAEISGKKLPEEVLKTWKLTLTENKYTFKTVGEADEGTWTLVENKEKSDEAKKYKAMDIKGGDAGPNKGKTFLCIYDLKGDTLTVCYDLTGKERPTEFKTKPDTKLFLVTYKREKP
ncbi:MAG: TIGR03067 domain-containing protein [Planctomycetes bacterium]|nr:TIGR03067 domain-containing protein [Planctomycetota bacterium]